MYEKLWTNTDWDLGFFWRPLCPKQPKEWTSFIYLTSPGNEVGLRLFFAGSYKRNLFSSQQWVENNLTIIKT